MKKRFVLLAVLFTLASGFGVSFLQAQGAAPQTYSFTTVSGSTMIKVTRDGPKEVVDQVMLAGPGREKDFRLYNLYDFQAHKIYTKVLSDPSVPCSVMEYTSPAAPSMFDLISGAPEMLGGSGGDQGQGKQLGTETINGIATNVMEVSSTEAKAKIWVAQQGGYRFPAKLEMRGPDGKVAMSMEMRQLSFAKPPASAFAPPAGCATVRGQSSATGGHAEMEVGGGASSAKAGPNVTAVKLQKIPNYTGACPAHVKLVGTITAGGPGKVYYKFAAGTYMAEGTVAFAAAGTKTVTGVLTFETDMGGGANLVATGMDAAGKHDFSQKASETEGFQVTCTSGGVN